MVTVEIAVGTASVLLLLALLLGVTQAVSTRSAVCQAVREAAREAAVGGEDPLEVASRSFGGGLDVAVTRSDRWVVVAGSARTSGIGGWIGGNAHCEVRTILEQVVP